MKDQYCTQCGQKTERRAANLLVCANGHENWINPIPGSACFIIKDGKVLYGVRSIEPNAGGLDVPGGFLDLNETLEQCAIRETKEEIGVDVRLVDFLGTYVAEYAGRPILALAYIGEITGGTLQPGDDMSGGDLVWRDIDDLPNASEAAWPWMNEAHPDLIRWYKKRTGRDG